MNEAQELVLQYFNIITGENEVQFEHISKKFSFNFQTAVKCAIHDTKNSLKVINGWANDKHEQLEKQLEELEGMV